MTKNTSDKPSSKPKSTVKETSLFTSSVETRVLKRNFATCLGLIGKENKDIVKLFNQYFEISCLNCLMIVKDGLDTGYDKFKKSGETSQSKINKQASEYLTMLIGQVKDGMKKRKWLDENMS